MVNIISSVSSFVLFLLSISLTHTFVPLNYYSASMYKVLFQSCFLLCLRGRTLLAITTFPLGKYHLHFINEETGSEVVICMKGHIATNICPALTGSEVCSLSTVTWSSRFIQLCVQSFIHLCETDTTSRWMWCYK